jgi:hypothetical protein
LFSKGKKGNTLLRLPDPHDPQQKIRREMYEEEYKDNMAVESDFNEFNLHLKKRHC